MLNFMLGFTLFIILLFLIQYSSFYGSMCLVGVSMTLMMALKAVLMSSGIFMFIFILIFVGGLLILLVSVSCVMSQEHGVLNKWLLPTLGGLVLTSLSLNTFVPESSLVSALEWLESDIIFLLFICLILIMGLGIISYILMKNKGMVRHLCSFGVMPQLLFEDQVME